MKARELHEKSIEDLQQLLLEMRRKQFNLRMQSGSGQPPRPSDISMTRRNIARIKTIMRERTGEGGA